MVQAEVEAFGGGCTYVNREDDAGDRGLRTSKLQYLPVRLAGKLRFEVQCEADRLRELPPVTTPRLTLTPLEERDEAAYNALCLDDARNRWWGYDYRQDLKGELTEEYYLSVATGGAGRSWAAALTRPMPDTATAPRPSPRRRTGPCSD